MVQIWQTASLTIPCNVSQKWLFLEGDEPSDMEHGVLKVVAIAPYVGTSSVSMVLSMEYNYILEGGDVKDGVSPSANGIQARYPDLFTTSVGDLYNGEVLVMKYKSGGEAAGFPHAVVGSYYKVGDNASIMYYDKDSALKKAEFFVTLVNYINGDGDKVLAPVADEETAKKYVRKSDRSFLLKYYNPGPWSSPDQPTFYEQNASTVMLLAPRRSREPMYHRFERLNLSGPSISTQSPVAEPGWESI